MSGSAAEGRTTPSERRKMICGSLSILLVAGIAVYFRLTPKFTTRASSETAAKFALPHTAPLAAGDIHETIRLSGTIGAERFHLIQAPQLLGSRGGDHTVGNIKTTTSPSSKPTFTPPTSSSLRGATNRFGDREGNKPPPSTPYSPPSTATTVYSSLAANQSLRGRGESDFKLTIMKLAAPGTRVRKGDVIAEFDRQIQLLRLDDYKDTVSQLNDNIEKMRSDLQTTRRAHDHIIFAAKSAMEKALLDLKTIEVRSANDAEALKLDADEARSRYQQLLKEIKLLEDSQVAQIHSAQIDRDQGKMELDRAQHNVDLMLVRAPMDGIVVLQTIYRGGDMGPAQQGDQLYPGRAFMEVIDPSSMLLNATVNQVDAQRIRIGMKAKVHLDAYPGLEFIAHIVGVNALSKTSYRRPNFKGDIDVRLKFDHIDENVIPDISGSADVVLASEQNALVAPRESIFLSPGGAPYIYLQTEAGWQRHDVRLGLQNNTHVSIRAGASQGDVLALSEPPAQQQPLAKQ